MTKQSEQVMFSLHTEWNQNLAGIVANYFDFFTIIDVQGYWKGIPERSARIDIITPASDQGKVVALASAIQRINDQEAVYVTQVDVPLIEVWRD